MIIALEKIVRTVNSDGTLTEVAYEWVEEMTRQVNLSTPIRGSGSPETVVTASPDQLYWDETGKALYIKDTGDGDTGWSIV